MTVRVFSNSTITIDEGILDAIPNGAWTFAAIFKRSGSTTDGTQFLLSLHSSVGSNQRLAFSYNSSSALQVTLGGITRTFGASFTISNDTWYCWVVRKADGDSVTPTANLYNYTTASWAGWTNGSGTLDDNADTIVEGYFGNAPGGFPLNGKIALMGMWSTTLSDTNGETLESAAANWDSLNPDALWPFTQASTSDPVLDFTGNGADQTAISGTSVDTTDNASGYDPTLGGTTISPSGIASAEAFGTAVITTGPVTVSPTGIASAEAFGTAVITTGPVTVSPSSIASAEAFGTPTITTGAVTVSPTGIASAEAFGTATITTGPVTISPTGIASAEAFGTAIVTVAGVDTISPTGIASAEAFGTPTITVGAVTISPIGIASAEAFGTPTIFDSSAGQIISPTGIPSQERFGRPVVYHRMERICDCSLLVDA